MKRSHLRIFIVAALALSWLAANCAQAGIGRLSRTDVGGSLRLPSPLTVLPKAVTAIYQYDDGTSESAVAFGDGTRNFEALWFNQFDVVPGAETITSVDIAWGSPGLTDFVDGTPVTIAIWSDPNNDGDPADASLIGSVAGTIQNAHTNTFITYTFSIPVMLPAGATSFFVGDMTPAHTGKELSYHGLDLSELAPNKSWVAGMSNGDPVDLDHPGNNDFVGTLDTFGTHGNYLVRANTSVDQLVMQSAASRKRHSGVGEFDILLPGIEDRGGKSAFVAVFTFNHDVTEAESVTLGCGTLDGISVDPNSSHRLLVTFDGVACNATEVTVTLNNVHDMEGNILASAAATMGILIGDIDGDGEVAKHDIGTIKRSVRQHVDATNFNLDLNLNGQVDPNDLQIARSHRGEILP